MKNILNWNEFINEGKFDKSESHILDDLKSNFRSWEYECDNYEDTEELATILSARHPELSEEEVFKYAKNWTGYVEVEEEVMEKLNPDAAIRNRGIVVFDDKNPNVLDKKDHFPINSAAQARNAIARVNQYKRSPKWYDGTLTELKEKVIKKVHKLYPEIVIAALEDEED